MSVLSKWSIGSHLALSLNVRIPCDRKRGRRLFELEII